MTSPVIPDKGQDIEAAGWILENFAIEWEADIRFNKMSDGSEPGPDVKIRPREQCDRVTTELRIKFMRDTSDLIVSLRKELDEAREALKPFAACVFSDNADVTINSARLCAGDFLRAAICLKDKQP